jgi:hypothetical protein
MAIRRLFVLALVLALAFATAVMAFESPIVRQPRASLDLGPLFRYTFWPSGALQPLPEVESAAKAMGLQYYDRISDMNGYAALEGAPFMLSCCIPGSTGAKEHLLSTYILEETQQAVQVASGLMVVSSGYCSLADSAADFAEALVKAELIRGFNANYSLLDDAILKAMVVAHYRWYSGYSSGEQAFIMSHPMGLDFALLIDPKELDMRMIWPASSETAETMAEMLKAYESFMDADPLGIRSTVASNYNALALASQRLAEGCDTSSPTAGST